MTAPRPMRNKAIVCEMPMGVSTTAVSGAMTNAGALPDTALHLLDTPVRIPTPALSRALHHPL
jgi:tRNA G10  N-methylase Trm11